MKKQMIAVLAGAMMMTAASSAFASFGDLQLTEIIYNGTAEYAVNMGTLTNVGGLDTTYTLTPSAISKDFNIQTLLGASATAATTYIAFYGSDYAAQGGAGQALVSNSSFAAPTANYGNMPGFQAGLTNVQQNFGAANDSKVVTIATGSSPFSTSSMFVNKDFNGLLDLTNAANFNNAMTLAALAADNTLMSIYSIDDQSAGGSGIGIKQTALSIGLTSVDGINFTSAVPSTPIPAAAYLLGSGLMGLVGMRRKKQA